MSRRRRPAKREILPDPLYDDILITKFVNNLMKDGKKSTAEQILYDAIDFVGQKAKENGVDVFYRAIKNVEPVLEVRSRRVGGSTYQVPCEVRAERRKALAIRWIIKYAIAKNGKTMAEKLANELFDASKNEGSSIKKREDTLKMAEANKAFAHFRW
ncbi:30S ribosomal protein S7 [bacterium]|nr:30S ribosomal protein S7 [bacterium]